MRPDICELFNWPKKTQIAFNYICYMLTVDMDAIIGNLNNVKVDEYVPMDMDSFKKKLSESNEPLKIDQDLLKQAFIKNSNNSNKNIDDPLEQAFDEEVKTQPHISIAAVIVKYSMGIDPHFSPEEFKKFIESNQFKALLEDPSDDHVEFLKELLYLAQNNNTNGLQNDIDIVGILFNKYNDLRADRDVSQQKKLQSNLNPDEKTAPKPQPKKTSISKDAKIAIITVSSFIAVSVVAVAMIFLPIIFLTLCLPPLFIAAVTGVSLAKHPREDNDYVNMSHEEPQKPGREYTSGEMPGPTVEPSPPVSAIKQPGQENNTPEKQRNTDIEPSR